MVIREFFRHRTCKTELVEVKDVFFCPHHRCRFDADPDDVELVKSFEVDDSRLPPRE